MKRPRSDIFEAINVERDRQETLWAGRHPHGYGSCASPDLNPMVKVAVLTEECGEVARAVLDGADNLRTELVEVAAVAGAWLESMPP